jgi:MFS family permease
MLPEKDNISRRDKSYLFKCLLLANFLQYLEAGAVPALLIQLSESFHMGPAQQGLLGGVVYLSLSLGGPFAGYLLKSFNHKAVISCAVAANMFFTLVWALTPVGKTYSTNMFIAVRFIMGLCQCVICVFLPLWTNENAPKLTRTSWMSYLQASVPFGVMTGYIIASILSEVSAHRSMCFGLLCWRWAFLIEIMLLCPLYLGLFYISAGDIQVCMSTHDASADAARSAQDSASRSATATLSESNRGSADNIQSAAQQLPSPSGKKPQRAQEDIDAPTSKRTTTPLRLLQPSPSQATPGNSAKE